MRAKDEFDYFNGIWRISDTDIIRSRQIMDLKKVDVRVDDIDLSIIAIKQNSDISWVFLENDRREYWKLLQKILEEWGSGEVTNLVKNGLKNGGTERVIWNYLLAEMHSEFNFSLYNYKQVTRFIDDVFYFPQKSSGYFLEEYDFDELFEALILLLPENLLNARKDVIAQKRIDIIIEYGKNFENKENILSAYEQSIDSKDIENVLIQNMHEIYMWKNAIDSEWINRDWGCQYLSILDAKYLIVEKKYCLVKNEELVERFGKLAEKKVAFLNLLKTITFEEGLEKYNIYQSTLRSLKQELEKSPLKESVFPLGDVEFQFPKYVEFYERGSILISNRLNKLNKNKLKRKIIAQNELDRAMMYFYETDTPENAEKLREKEDYLENKKNGEYGEKEVDYALKWLDKTYIVIQKKASGKYGEKAIVLYNPEFLDESQEYDHIVIGKQGIFLIETKYYVGKLIVDANGNWIRIKKDGVEEGERNPIQQLRRHEKLLRSIVGEYAPIISIICMAHPKMIIEGAENCQVPLVKSDLLVEYIENYPGEVFTSEEIQEYGYKIEQHMK